MTVLLGEHPTELERIAARLLEARVAGRNTEEVLLGTPGSSSVVAEVAGPLDALGEEGYRILRAGGRIVCAGATDRAVLFGAGRVWRELSGAGIGAEPIEARPACSVRVIYFADHMGNWYSHAPEEDVREHLEDMALWGYNELMTCLEVRPGETFVESVARVRRLEDYARTLGMRVGTVLQSNSSFMPPPDGMRATSGPIPGAHDVCASKPGAREFLVNDKREFYELMRPYDVVTLWPYDGGGCYCDDCRPWARTYLELSEAIAADALDGAETRASAWFFELHQQGEDDALWSYLARRPSWFRFLLAGAREARRWIAEGRRLPDPYRALLFPDVAMFDGAPWGGRGANPAPVRFATELRDTREVVDGAVVYSEGRYDDVNKVVWALLLWSPDADPAAMVAEYARVYFGAHVAADVAALALRIEEDMARLPDTERWRRGIFHPAWDEDATAIEARLDAAVRHSWRWRYLRAKTALEAHYAASVGGDAEARERLRREYEHLRDELNVYDSERSLATWFWAELDEAFPEQTEQGAPA